MKQLARFVLVMFGGALVTLWGDQQDTAGQSNDGSVNPATMTEAASPDFVVQVNQSAIPVYLAKVSGLSAAERVPFDLIHFSNVAQTSFASFDLQGQAKVVVTCTHHVQRAKILPTSSGIEPVVSENHVTFTVSNPCQLVLEIDGDWIHSLQLFVNPPETDVPDIHAANVIYYGPGAHEVDSLVVTTGQTVYVAAGAVVYGKTDPGSSQTGPIFQLHGDNIILRGRGILDGSRSTVKRTLLEVRGSNIQVEGVILRDSPSWTFPILESDHVQVKNVKIIGYRANSDGIDICNSRNVDVSNCFLRTFDDLVVIKSFLNGDASEITVKSCVLWNEFAHALSLGAELRKPVENVRFSDCDIIHDKGREWLLRIYNCDSASVKNVVFDNIRIEEARRLISLWIGKAFWSKEQERGHINDVTFSYIYSVTPEVPGPLVDLVGFDADHAIHGVQFHQLQINGRDLNLKDVKQNPFVSGIKISP